MRTFKLIAFGLSILFLTVFLFFKLIHHQKMVHYCSLQMDQKELSKVEWDSVLRETALTLSHQNGIKEIYINTENSLLVFGYTSGFTIPEKIVQNSALQRINSVEDSLVYSVARAPFLQWGKESSIQNQFSSFVKRNLPKD